MPFDANTGPAAGRKSAAARWGNKDPASVRNRQVKLTITQAELDMMDAKAAETGVSRVELVVRAVRDYKPRQG